MKSKIGKLGKIGDVSESAEYKFLTRVINEIIEKQGKIIDHLNSQDQEEENTVCEGCGKTITSRFMQSYTKGDGMHSYCLSCDPEKQDTPEEEDVQEWEERFMDVLETFKDEICSNFLASSKPLTDFIQQLLEEREVFTKDELFMLKLATNDIHNKGNGAYDEIGEKIERMLSKLTTK